MPIAFRAGSTGKKRVHIFWQRRIDADSSSINTHQAPYWYPFKTDQGAMRVDRVVFPIPPGVHWRDVKAVPVPAEPGLAILPEPKDADAPKRSGRTPKPPKAPLTTDVAAMGGFFIPAPPAAPAAEKRPRPSKAKTPAAKIDPKYLAGARELRDRYLERVNTDANFVLPVATGKYEVSRSLPPTANAGALPLLKAG